jgi:hypothetical protein
MAAPDLSRLEFRFARTMPDMPHWYVVRTPANEADYVALFRAVQHHGVNEKFGKRRYRYWRPGDGFKYWTMTTDVKQSRVINRAKIDNEADDAPMIEMDLNAEDLACAGLRRASDDEWRIFSRADLTEAVAGSAPEAPKRRERRPTMAVALKEANKAGRLVKSAAVYPDRVEITFGEPSKVAPDDSIDTPEALRRLI